MMKIVKEDMGVFLRKLLYWVMSLLFVYTGILIYQKAITYNFGNVEAIATIAYFWLIVLTDWDKCLKVMFE